MILIATVPATIDAAMHSVSAVVLLSPGANCDSGICRIRASAASSSLPS